ncbi:hypothetical protein NGF19_00690 [Streptomyces sp. RY43-2]|uniref:Integral membrane protein n=1 Tax=Streptomyces macrolidinus TaxID=2952607 RepID=A0ABT0Z6D0_9ACTN|nr:hypothetical protein [Streptomyces macrolidinus]MCN9239316.1 hypothetical protein [Streptomyces macrolidinus]
MLRGGRQRIHGCVWAALLLPCTWGLFMPLLIAYPLARSARNRARRIFPARAHRRIEDPEVMRVQKARAWSAGVMSLLILAAYGKPGDVTEAQEQFFMRLTVTPWLLLLTAPVVVALLFRWAPPHVRHAMRPQVRRAGRSALCYFGALFLIPLLGWATIQAMPWTVAHVRSPLLQAPAVAAMFIPMTWFVLFVAFASRPAVRSAFNTSEVHAALPALLTGVLVWEFMIIGLFAGGLPPGPPWIQTATVIGGPASVTAIAWWEIRRLRTRHGVVLRGY